MKTALGTMLQAQLPFEVDDIDDFWTNHKIRKHSAEKVMVNRPQFNTMSFENEEDFMVTVFYKDQEAKLVWGDYVHYISCWWAGRGAWKKRKELGIMDHCEPPEIEEI